MAKKRAGGKKPDQVANLGFEAKLWLPAALTATEDAVSA